MWSYFLKNIKPIKCVSCNNDFHKTTCTNESRWKIEKIIKERKPWTCAGCKRGHPPTPPQDITQDQPEELQSAPTTTEKPGKCHATSCKKPIRKGADYLSCTTCSKHFHKQESCSGMSRKQVENLNRASWQCLACQNIKANPRPQGQTDTDEGIKMKIRKIKVSSLNILHLV